MKKQRLLSLFIILLIAIGAVVWWQTGGQHMSEKKQMQEYLENKYGEEFVVKNYRVEGSGLGVEGDPTADAYPKKDASLKFEVWDRGHYKDDHHAYSDEYVGALWQREEYENLKPLMQKVFNTLPSYNVKINTTARLDNVVKSSIGLKEGLEKYGHKISITISINSTERITATSRDHISARLYELIQQLSNINANITLIYNGPKGSGGVAFENDQLRLITLDQITNKMKESL